MKEINIGSKIMSKRKEKGVTQEDLAAYIGVSKASVSKWETSQSYPDITILPVLATYFDITVDELIGYSPQLTKESIRKLYASLAEKFANDGYESTLQECNRLSKKYYSCYEFQLQLAILYTNYAITAPTEVMKKDMLTQVITSCQRIKQESLDAKLMRSANSLEATANLILNQIVEVVDLLEDTVVPYESDEVILANAYFMLGKEDKAKETLQFSIYQHLGAIMADLQSYAMMSIPDYDRFKEIMNRAKSIGDIFFLEQLNPNTMAALYVSSAQGYMQLGEEEEAIAMLKKYCNVCHNFKFPLKLQGDEFFNQVEEKFDELNIGTTAPRDEKTVKAAFVFAVTQNPIFKPLATRVEFKQIVKELENI